MKIDVEKTTELRETERPFTNVYLFRKEFKTTFNKWPNLIKNSSKLKRGFKTRLTNALATEKFTI